MYSRVVEIGKYDNYYCFVYETYEITLCNFFDVLITIGKDGLYRNLAICNIRLQNCSIWFFIFQNIWAGACPQTPLAGHGPSHFNLQSLISSHAYHRVKQYYTVQEVAQNIILGAGEDRESQNLYGFWTDNADWQDVISDKGQTTGLGQMTFVRRDKGHGILPWWRSWGGKFFQIPFLIIILRWHRSKWTGKIAFGRYNI